MVAIVALAKKKGWELYAAHVRSNHVHVVVAAGGVVERVMNDIKTAASRRLNKAFPEEGQRVRWARHGSTKHLFDEDSIEESVRYVLDEQGENVFYLGALGAGHATKLINNFMGMTTVCAMSQAFAVAERSGIDRGTLYDIMSAGPSNSPFMSFCKNYAVDGVSDLGFSINNANKDLRYFVQMMSDLGSGSLIAEGTSASLRAAVDRGMGPGNVPEIYDYFVELKKEDA